MSAYSPADWQPGAVAMVTIDGEEQRAIRTSQNTWRTGRDFYIDGQGLVTDARPLVVLDPESDDDAVRLRHAIDACRVYPPSTIRAALHSLVTPPKPEEPTGLGAVVEDAEGADWHRSRTGRWIAEDGLRTRAGGWGHIDAVRVLSEGVTP